MPIYGYHENMTLLQTTPTCSLEFNWLDVPDGHNEDLRYNPKAKIDYKDFFKPIDHEDKEFLNKIQLTYYQSNSEYKSFTDEFSNEIDGEPIETNVEHYIKGSQELIIPSYSELLLQLIN
jgi:hypothetical protein